MEVALEMKADWTRPLSSARIIDSSKIRESSFGHSSDVMWPPSLLHLPLLSCIAGTLDCSCANLLRILLPRLQKEVNLKDSEGE